MSGASFDDQRLTLGTIDALEIAASKREGRPLGTCGILLAIIACDETGDWDWVQLQSTFVTPDDSRSLDSEESPGRHSWRNVPLTNPAAQALVEAERIAHAYQLLPIPSGVLALGVLSNHKTAASRALLASTQRTHRQLLEIVQETVLGTDLESLPTVLHLDPSSSTASSSTTSSSTTSTSTFAGQHARPSQLGHQQTPAKHTEPPKDASSTRPAPTTAPPSRADLVGFRLGTFVGAVIVSTVAGLPIGGAMALAAILQQGAAGARKKGRLQGLLLPAAALALVAAIALAVTGQSGFSDDVSALEHLRNARSAIADDNRAIATRELGSAALYENESVTINTLAACLDWSLGFKDYATVEAQWAINSGYVPGDDTTFKGRGCFLDTLPFSGLALMRLSELASVIFPLPDRTDPTGVELLKLAYLRRTSDFAEATIALACLADRYDFRMTASDLFTGGLDANAALGRGGLPDARLRQCLSSKSVRARYKFFQDPITGNDEYVPTDMATRIPTPTKQKPPSAACWARFPATQPCNTND